jgi:hypothetical protein
MYEAFMELQDARYMKSYQDKEAVKKEAAASSETLISVYKSILHNIPEDFNLCA